MTMHDHGNCARCDEQEQRVAALEADLAAKDAEAVQANAAWAKAVAEKARYAEATERDRETWHATRGALLDEHRALRERLAEKNTDAEVEGLDWARRYDDAVQPLQKRCSEYLARAEAAERERDHWLLAASQEGSHRLAAEADLAAKTAALEKIADLRFGAPVSAGIASAALASSPGAAPTHEALSSQVDRLARFIMEEIAGEPSRSEGAIDTAIRLLSERVCDAKVCAVQAVARVLLARPEVKAWARR